MSINNCLAPVCIGFLLSAAPVFAQQVTDSAELNIAAGALETSLRELGRQRGIRLLFDAAALKGLQAPALSGRYSTQMALERLLYASGWHAQQQADGSYQLMALDSAREGSLPLEALEIRSALGEFPYGGGQAMNKEYIEAQPSGNADIGSLLVANPAVRHDDARRSGKRPGEISPAEISIHGAHFYQNAFIVDGMNFNNDIDPAEEASPYRLATVPGNSQGFALDTDLIDSISVLDHNISAAYGGFNGGVVDVKTRLPKRAFSGKFSAQMTRSAWTRYHIHPEQQDEFEHASGWADGHPEFEKTFVRGRLEGYVTDNVGLMFAYSGRRSRIPAYFYSSHLVNDNGREKEKQWLRLDNYLLKGIWHVQEALDIELNATLAPSRSHYFRSNIKGSGIDIVSGGQGISLKADWRADGFKLEQQISWNRMQQSRDPQSDDYMSWRRSTSKDWGPVSTNTTNEGEFGEIEQRMDRTRYALDIKANPIDWFGMEHRLIAGAGITHTDTHYKRLSESSTYTTPRRTTTCTNSSGVTDNYTCSMGLTNNGWPGQFLSRRTRYAKGEFEFTHNDWQLYMEDDIQMDRLRVRPGLRYEQDSYMDKSTLAPRFSLSYELGQQRSTVLRLGLNRYYGRNAAAWQLREKINRLRYNGEQRNSLEQDWTTGTQQRANSKFNKLKIAYSDEIALGLSWQWGDWLLDAAVVKRMGRDEVIQVHEINNGADPDLTNNYTTFTNDGRSDVMDYTLNATLLRPIDFAGTTTQLRASAGWLDVKQNTAIYSNDSEGDFYRDNPIIQYRGKFMRYDEKPVENFSRPYVASFISASKIHPINLDWNNTFSFRSGYTSIFRQGTADYNGTPVPSYQSKKFGSSLTWDMRLGYKLPLFETQSAFIHLDVFNVTDRMTVHGTRAGVNASPLYETGRQFWLEMGYEF